MQWRRSRRGARIGCATLTRAAAYSPACAACDCDACCVRTRAPCAQMRDKVCGNVNIDLVINNNTAVHNTRCESVDLYRSCLSHALST
jgi:hypothetical protein